MKSIWVAYILPVVLCVLPVAIYGLFFQQIALNINYIAYDDTHVLEIVNQWNQHSDFASRFHYLTVGFPEHRIVFTRFSILLSYWLTGGVKLTHLMLLSNGLWVGQLLILYLVFKRIGLSIWYFVPVSWLLLSVQSYENIFWGTSSVGNFGLLFFTTISFYFFTNSSKYGFGLSLFFAVCAMFSYGNGLAVFVVLGLYLLLSQKWKKLIILGIVFGIVLFVYSQTTANAPPAALNLAKLSSYPLAFSCFFGFLGGSVNFNPNIYAETTFELWSSVAWGLVLFSTLLFFFRKQLIDVLPWSVSSQTMGKSVKTQTTERTQTIEERSVKTQTTGIKLSKPLNLSPTEQFLFLFFIFICITAVGVVYKRSGADFLPGMFKGRYKMYSTWLVVVVYLAWVNFKGKSISLRFLSIPILAAIGINLLSLYSFLPSAVNNRRSAVAVEFNSMNNQDLIGLKMFDITQNDFLRIQSLYKPEIPFQDIPIKLYKPINDELQLDTVFCNNGNLFVIWKKDFLPIQKNFTDGGYVIIKSKSNIYLSSGQQDKLPFKTFLRRGWYWDRGFTAMFQGESAQDGLYSIYVVLRKNGENKLYKTSSSFEVKRTGKEGFEIE